MTESTRHRRPRPAAIPAALLGLALALAATPARAQDFDEEEAPTPQQGQMQGMVVQNNFAFDDSNFDQWVFNGRLTVGNAGGARAYFADRLALKLDELDRTCALDEGQKLKLRLAGQGDAKRFLDLYDEKFRKFQSVKHDQNKINEIFQEIQPLQQILNNGTYGPGSIFGKAVAATLRPEQAERQQGSDRERRASRYRARIELYVGQLDESVGLTAEQRNRLIDLLAAEIALPPRAGQYEYYLVMYRAAQVDSGKLQELFDPAQWKVVSPMLDQAKGYSSFLKQYGLLTDEDEKAIGAAKARKAAGGNP